MKDQQTALPNFWMLLDRLAEKAGSDRQAALILGVTQGSYSKWRRHIAYPEDEQAITIANYLQIDPATVLLIVRADRTRSRAARNIWLKIAEQAGKVATVAAVAIGAGTLPPPSSGAVQSSSAETVQRLCIMSTRRRRQSSLVSQLTELALQTIGARTHRLN